MVLILFVGMVNLLVENSNPISKQEGYEQICDDLELELLSVSTQVFGDDYVVCVDKATKETREILI